MIEVKNLSFAYSQKSPVLKDISFSAEAGEIINILGPNGCGKSTLLKAILGFLPLKGGQVSIDGHDVTRLSPKKLARALSYVPQMHSGAFNYAAIDVVLMGRNLAGPWYKYTSADYDIAHEALRRVRLDGYAQRLYLHLSGGERQLVLIARALAQGPGYFIMDEPVTGLDYGNQFHLLETIKDLSQDGFAGKKPMFMLTTHHPEHAIFLGGRALMMQGGALLADGSVDEVISSGGICRLYGLRPELLDKIVNIYGKHNGMAG